MRIINLFSGSRGNCTLVDTGERTLLIDAGGSARAIEQSLSSLGYSIDRIGEIFITHEHTDHTHALSVIAKKHEIPIHITRACANALSDRSEALCSRLVVHDGEYSLALSDGARIDAFLTPHDSVECVGYRIEKGGSAFALATDLGYVTQRVYDMMKGCELVVIESNHDRDMVQSGGYTPVLKQRILSRAGHLSNEDCAELCAALARAGTRHFMLAHLSKENNTPELALQSTLVAVERYGAEVLVSSQDRKTEFEKQALKV